MQCYALVVKYNTIMQVLEIIQVSKVTFLL